MHIAVFCGSSMPRNKEFVEAAAALGRRIAQEDTPSSMAAAISASWARSIFTRKVPSAHERGENAEMKQQIEYEK